MTAVSVIMPVYNSQRYVENAVRSILRQEFDPFEVILVDDGSTDQSGDICSKLAEENSKVKVIHKKNGGICSARNAGLAAAEGEYITFCDNDDEYLPGLLRDNYMFAKETDADLVRFCRRKATITAEGEIVSETVTGGFERQVIDADDFARKYDIIKKARSGVWTGLYKRSFLERHQIVFDESMRYGYEDQMFNLRCYACFDRLALNPGVYYTWFQRIDHSTTGKFHQNVVRSILRCLLFEQRLVEKERIRKIRPGTWQYVLITDYISELYERLEPRRSGNLTDRDRRRILRSFRNMPKVCFGQKMADLPVILKSGVKNNIIWFMFKAHLTWPLYLMIHKRPFKK